MTLRVEQRPVAENMALWADLLRQTRDDPPTPESLAWRYLDNPHGAAQAWVLSDAARGTVAGFTVVMPRIVARAGQRFLAWMGADFSILPRYRALGPALSLRRAAREAIDQGDADLLFSFPNQRMTLIHERAGHVRVGRLARFARPVSVAPYLGRRMPAALASVAAFPIDVARRALFGIRVRGAGDDVEPVAIGGVDSRFDTLADEMARGERVTGRRDAAWVRWRYFGQPGWDGVVLASMRGRAMTGYAVTSRRAEVTFVEDLCGVDGLAVQSLIRATVGLAARQGSVSVSFTALESAIAFPALERLGFREREEEYSVYAYIPPRHAGSIVGDAPSHWHLTVGDRDV